MNKDLVDTYPSALAGTSTGLEYSKEAAIVTLLTSNIKGLDLIGSNVNLSGLEVETANDEKRAFILKEILKNEKNNFLSKYENILIDCPPSLSLLTIMSLVAADELLVPLQTEFFALEVITQLVKTIDRIKVKLNPQLKVR